MRVLGFAVALSLLTCVLFALAPAIRASRPDIVAETKPRGLGGNLQVMRLRHLLIAVQVALSVIAVVSAGLFLRSLQRAMRIDPGFAVDRLAMMNIDLGAQGYNEAQGRIFQRQVLERASVRPGVEGVVLADLVPLRSGGNTRSIYLEGQDPSDRRNGYIIPTGIVSADYFRVLGIATVRGRVFDDGDQPTTRAVAVANEAMVRQFWPGQEPIGKRVRFIRTGYFEIVGVVKDSAYGTIGGPPTPILYRPLTQVYQANVSVIVRAQRPDAVLGSVRGEIQRLDARLPIANVMSLADALRESLWAHRLAASLLTVLGFISLMLAAVGIYGVMAYSVSQRTQEIGLRLALGAHRGAVLNLVLGQSFRLSLVGVAVGLAISIGATRFIAHLLYGNAVDVVTFFIASATVVVAALVASFVPARRATRIDPMIALRND
jgi:predicted permease